MKKIQTFIYVLLMGFAFAACQDDSLGGTEQGGIRIALTDGTAGVDVTTRSTPSELFDGFKQKFKFQIKGGDNYDQTHKWTEDVIPLAAGVYDITATCGTEQADGVVKFDAPCYTGTKEGLKVNAGETATTAEISCKVTNALVSIQFDDEYKEYITDATYAMIAVESGTETNWADLSTSAYFKAGSSITQLKLYKDGTESTYADILAEAKKNSNFPETFAAGDHLILTLSIAKANGNAAIKVSKVEVKKVTIEETIPLEWLPKPKVEATGFDNNNTLTFAETETKEAKLNLDLASTLQDMRLKFKFGDAQFSNLNRDTGYLYSNAEDKAVIETTLGISVSDDNINLNNLLAKIQTNAGETTTNTIEVDVKANNRWSSEDETANRTYTITCNKPVFKVDAYPGNIWTKEFTMNALREEQVESGDFSKISQNIKYQYSTDKDKWTDLGDDLRQANLTPGTTYYIRGLYRDAVPGEVAEVMTYPVIALENGDMENWDYEITNDAREPLTENLDFIYWKKWFPWSSVSTSSIWNTVNQTTTQDGNVPSLFLGWKPTPPYVGCCYVANSGTIPVEGNDAHNGKSALIRTVGWGSGSTAAGEISDIKHVTPGELYLGTYDLSSHQPVYGIEYKSRPTNVKFWCKYEPKSSDLMIAQIVIMDEEGKTIGSASVPDNEAGATGWTEKTLSIAYTEIEKEPAKMYILFKCGTSTDSGILDKSGVNLSDGEHVGSKLYIDDIQLIYDK